MPRSRNTPLTPNRPGGEQIDFSPIHIRTFQECPQKYYWRYVRKTKTPKHFSRNLEVGRAAHNVLAFVWNARREGIEDPDDLFELTSRYLKESAYPDEDRGFYEEDVASIVGHVARALATLTDFRSIVSVERSLGYVIQGGQHVEIHSKIDLILLHDDGTYEHIDYKTGKRERDQVQEVMGRVVLKAYLNQIGEGDHKILTTTVFSADGSIIREELDRHQFAERWPGIVGTIDQIRTSERWPSSEGHQCRWCDFKDFVCSAHTGKLSDGE